MKSNKSVFRINKATGDFGYCSGDELCRNWEVYDRLYVYAGSLVDVWEMLGRPAIWYYWVDHVCFSACKLIDTSDRSSAKRVAEGIMCETNPAFNWLRDKDRASRFIAQGLEVFPITICSAIPHWTKLVE